MKIMLFGLDAATQKMISCSSKEYCFSQNIDCSIHLLQRWKMILNTDFSDVDALFVDTDFSDPDIHADVSLWTSVKALQEQYGYCFGVVFISRDTAFSYDAFQANALHYLCKPLQTADIEEALERILRLSCRRRKPFLPILSSHKTILVPIDSIQYIEVFNNCSVLHTDKEIIRTYTSLTTLYEQLNKKIFMRPHRSYIVSMKMIKHFNYDHITLKNELVITLSRSRRSALRQQYHDYLLEQA